MAIAKEKYASRVINDNEEQTQPTAEATWLVFGAADDPAAFTALNGVIPAFYNFPSGRTGYLKNISLKDVAESTLETVVTHEAILTYGYRNPLLEYEFEIGGQSVTLTHSINTTPYTGGGRTAPDFNGGINVSADGKIQGIQVERALSQFAITKHWETSLLTEAYQLTLEGLASRVNNATFRGRAAGSVRFLGARGRINGEVTPITYRFEHSPNETNVTVGDITVAVRNGFQYLDVYRRKVSDSGAKKIVELPHSVFVHDVFESGDFSQLGLS